MYFTSFQNIFTVLILAVLQHSYASTTHLRIWKRQTQSCRSNQFQCGTGECIAQFLICDGEQHCTDGSDETKKICENLPCPSYAFRCDYGACVEADAKCNDVKNCADSSDEKDCAKEVSNGPCKTRQFQCKSGECIDPFFLCDGNKDCSDASDETSDECSGFACPSFAFQCDYGACIAKDSLCNGKNECADGSDEKPQQCVSFTKITEAPANDSIVSTIVPSQPLTTSLKEPQITPSTKRPIDLTSTSNNGCILPPQPQNGEYRLGGCYPPSCKPIPGTKIQTNFISYTCNPGFNMSGFPVVACDSGWLSPFPNCSKVSCAALNYPSRDIECKLNDVKYDCKQAVEPGTSASVKCNPFYEHGPEFSNFDMVCQSDGKWSKVVTSCIPICGKSNPGAIPYLSYGRPAKFAEFPWHVGIYKVQKDKMLLICGGSIISERVIISAAHCFWDESAARVVDSSSYRLAVGKYFIEWETTTQHVQYPEIDKVIVHEHFKGAGRFYEHDIAVIIVKKDIKMTAAVRPICIDYNKKYTNSFSPGTPGVVVGWGITEKMQQSEVIRTANIPYIDYETCLKGVPSNFESVLGFDKFCAGYRNGTSVCPGDSGGGFASNFNKKWYLMGIVSVGVLPEKDEECNIMHYATFTKVFEYYGFIQRYTDNSK